MRFYAYSRCVRRFIPIAHGRMRLYRAIRETPLLQTRTCPLLRLVVMRMPAQARLLLSVSPAPEMPSALALACMLLLLRVCCHLPLLRLPPLTTRVHLPSAKYVVPLAFTVLKASAL